MRKIYVSDISFCEAAENRKAFTFREKLNIVSSLKKAGLSAVELPAVQNAALDSVVYSTVADSDIKICVNAGVTAESIKETYECVKNAKELCLQVVLPVSTVQMEYMYHLKADKMIDRISALVSEAKKYCDEVEFVALDATRATAEFLVDTCKCAAESGAVAVTICDTAGICFPEEISELVKKVKSECNVKVYIEVSNELKLAPACAISAVMAGADGVKTSAVSKKYLSSAQFADIARARGEAMGIETDLDITLINNTVKNIADVSAVSESGVSADNNTVSADATLDDITAEIKALGYELSVEDNGKVYEEFKRVAAKKNSIAIRELEAIIASSAMQVPSTYHVINYVVNSGNIINATANITLEKDGEQMSGVSIGDGPIDAAFHAIEQIIGHHYELDDFQIQAVTKGREAVGSSVIRLRSEGKLYSGNGVSTDIIGACIRAYINALNKIVYEDN